MLKRRAVKRTFVLIYAVSMFIGVTPGVQSIAGEPVATNDATVPVDDGSSTNEETAVETAASTQPNFVLILTDDQKWDTIGRCMPELDPYDFNAGADACMPNLQELLTSNGLTFLHGNVTQSLCCPSRASILTGQYTTTNGVTYNNAQLLDDTSTLATWLEAAGYRNGLVGKYLNGYGLGPLAEHIPPGWDRWETFHDFRNSDNPYTDYPWISWREGDTDPVVTRINDADSTSSEACADGNLYSTDYMCNLAIDFLQEDTETPFFLHLSPASPHLPLSVADRHLNAFQGMNIPRYPSTNVLPSPNTPSHLPPTDLPDRVLDRIERTMVTSIELTLTVDDMIGVVHDELQSDGRLDNTVWIFISDNGISSGEHHWRNKGCEYYTCHQVPYVVVCPTGVCPGAIPGSVDGDNYALNIDIAPTIADLAGATPTIGVDGSSLVPLLNDPNVELRDEWFMHGNDPEYEGIAGVGTDGDWYKYVELTSAGEFEMYNLADDPWEIVNLAGNGDYADVEADLAARLAAHLGGPPPNIPPIGSFTSACTDLACDFTDTSTDSDGSVVGWDWDFGDGSGTSTVQSPSYTYVSAGTYPVSLTVTDDDGATDTVTEDVTLSGGNVDPVASFTSSCTDLGCDFTDTSTDLDGSVVGWDWDFGDGSGTSTVQSPSYTYVSAGTYSVSLTVTDDDGATDMVTEDVTVSEGNVDPVASFTSSCTDLACDFTDTSTDADGSVVGWDWDFGDGSGTSTVQSPSYTFSPAGTYSVSLTVTDDDGATDTVTEDVTVSEGNLDPTASFSWLCADLACDFTDESTDSDGTVVSWDWDFGDGSGTSTVQSPSYVFSSAGTYPVELTVTDDDGATDVVTRDVTVTTAGGAGAFIESDGTVVFEAESYFDSITRSGDTWTEVTDPSGFSGDGAMQTLPDDGTRLRTDLPSTSPEMTYEVDFTATGTYFVWVRTWAPDVRSKGVFVGIDGVVSTGLSAGGNENWADGVGEWAWSNVGRLPAPVTVEVTTAGVHTIQVFMGDDGLIMDKVVLTTDAGFVPTDEGPPESPRQPI